MKKANLFHQVREPGSWYVLNLSPVCPLGSGTTRTTKSTTMPISIVFNDVWCHGDWVERTVHNGIIIHGRSDATLNPGGVRIGTSEIYRQVEQVEGVLESLAVGQDWQADVRVILFVILKDGLELTAAPRKRSQNPYPLRRLAPSCAGQDCPSDGHPSNQERQKSPELAVRDVIHGRAIKNVTSLANPEALELFRDITVLQED